MKITTVKSDEVRAILTALIVHDNVLSTVHTKLGEEKRPFGDKWSNTILQWCRLYYAKYQKAPRKHITQIFSKQAEKINDEDAASLIESFLTRLSKDYEKLSEQLNEKYLLDLASNYFERIRLQRYTDNLQTALENRDLEEAKAKVSEFQSIDFSAAAWSSPFDDATIKQTFHHLEKDRSLLRFPGKELDRFLSPYFTRDGFVSFVAPEKAGKSFWVQETVYQALRGRRKVLYYVLGDMSQEEANERLYCRITRCIPTYEKENEIRLPVSLTTKNGEAKVKFQIEERPRITVPQIIKARQRLIEATATKELPIKMRCAGASVVSAGEIEQDVKLFAQSGWVPDMVAIDYADLLAPEPHSRSQEYRHQVNETWKVLRRIALDYHLLMVTATQAAATSYDARIIRKKDFSEDKRKASHVTGMLGLNRSAEERKLGVYRLNWTFLRGGAWSESDVVFTAGNLAIASPCILSSF